MNKGPVSRVINFVKKFPGMTPVEKMPKEIAAPFNGLRILPWFTERNDFSVQLLQMYESCNSHRACIETKADYATRGGFGLVKGKGHSVLKTKTIASETSIEDDVIDFAAAWMENVNENGQTLLAIAHEMVVNLEATGNVFLELVRGGTGNETFFSVYNHHANSCLYALNEDDSVTHVYVSSDWSEDYTSKNPPVKLPVYPRWENINGAERCVVHLKSYSIGRDYYGLPMFIAAFKENLMEYEITDYNLEEFFAGFMPKVYMMFMGANGWEPQQKHTFMEGVQNTYTKQDKGQIAQRVMVHVEESETLKPFIHEFNNASKEGDFRFLKESATNAIHKAHRWHPVLAGELVAAGFDDGKKFKTIFEIYNETTIRPLQEKILKVLNVVFSEAAQFTGAPFKGYSLTLSCTCPVSFIGDLDINALLTVDEGREILGKEKINDDTGLLRIKQVPVLSETKNYDK